MVVSTFWNVNPQHCGAMEIKWILNKHCVWTREFVKVVINNDDSADMVAIEKALIARTSNHNMKFRSLLHCNMLQIKYYHVTE